MPKIHPKNGVNFRLPAYETPYNQWLSMQNMDMKHSEVFEQIQGSSKYHGTVIGTERPTAIFAYYNNSTGDAHVLVCAGGSIYRKKEGNNEFELLKDGLVPNRIRSAMLVGNRLYIAHPVNGLLDYDGFSIEPVNNSPNMTDVIFVKEINRAFGISADIPNAIFWTDDVSTMGAVPIVWDGLNADSIPPTEGDTIEKLAFLNGRLVYFMTNSTWIEYVNGAPQNWRYEKSPTVVGWIAPKTIKQVGTEFWGLGHSTSTGVGLYAFNGQTARLLSYDAEPIIKRINENMISEACAEYVDNIYKLSFALDAETENEHTLHFDVINQNQETNSPNVYGVHTYGFHSSCVLNLRKFKGEHIFGKLYNSGTWIFKADNCMTQYGNPMTDDGDLIPTILLSGIKYREAIGKEEYDEIWEKRYGMIWAVFPPKGSWSCKIEVLTDFSNEVAESYENYMEGGNTSIEALILGSTPLDQKQVGIVEKIMHTKGRGIQLRVSNYIYKTRMGFHYLGYDVAPVRRRKELTRVSI